MKPSTAIAILTAIMSMGYAGASYANIPARDSLSIQRISRLLLVEYERELPPKRELQPSKLYPRKLMEAYKIAVAGNDDNRFFYDDRFADSPGLEQLMKVCGEMEKHVLYLTYNRENDYLIINGNDEKTVLVLKRPTVERIVEFIKNAPSCSEK